MADKKAAPKKGGHPADESDQEEAVVRHSRLAGSPAPETTGGSGHDPAELAPDAGGEVSPATGNPVRYDEGHPVQELRRETANAPAGTTTTGAVPGGILDPNNRTIVRPSPEGDGPARDAALTAARDEKLATDGTREAEAELGTGAAASEAPSDEDDSSAEYNRNRRKA